MRGKSKHEYQLECIQCLNTITRKHYVVKPRCRRCVEDNRDIKL